MITLPVSFALDGVVAPGSTFYYARFLDYSFAISALGGSGNSPHFQVNVQVTSTGVSALGFNGTLSFNNLNQASQPLTALVELILSTPQLNVGSIDFYNTAMASITLPPGFTATTSSGVPLVFAPVPEPAAVALWSLGLAAVGVASRRRVVV